MNNLNNKVYILTNGCPENRIDSSRMEELFRQNNYEVTGAINQADFVVFNSCALTNDMENESIRLIDEIKRRMLPSAKLIVCGCLVKINPERLRSVYQGPFFDSDKSEELDKVFRLKKNPEEISANCLMKTTNYLNKYKWFVRNLNNDAMVTVIKILNRFRNRINKTVNVCSPDMFCIKICSGCLGECSFCAVRLSRGKLKSKPLDKVVSEFEKGLQGGYKKFALLGTEVGAYGKDLGIDLTVLLKELVNKKGDFKIRLRNLHPRYLIAMLPELRKIFATGKISFVACSPESGSNRILGLMNRGYEIEDFKKAIKVLNKEFPWIKIRTQLIAGFPTETDDEFKESMRLLDELHFDFVEVYAFEPRKNTKASTMAGQITTAVKQKRYLKLLLKSISNDWLRYASNGF